VLDAHWPIFEALADHLAAGWPVEIVLGNHDIELAFPDVQERLRKVLCRPGTDPALLRFHPWIFYVRGVLYAEHGQQHHPTSSFPRVLEPWRAGGDVDQVLSDQLRDIRRRATAAVGGRAAGGRSGPALTDRSRSLAAAARDSGVLLRSLTERSTPPLTPRARARRERYGAVLLPDLAARTGLPVPVVRSLHELTDHPPLHTLSRVGRKLRRLTGKRIGRTPVRHGAHVERDVEVARAIHARLAAEGLGVPFYLFGHTHAAAIRPLDADRPLPQYVNTGAWSARQLGRSRADAVPTYVTVVVDRTGSRAELHRYDGVDGVAVPSSLPDAGAARVIELPATRVATAPTHRD
jgi:hypothetical protein